MSLGKRLIDIGGGSSGPVGTDNFNTVLYSGNSSTQSITGVGFQPSFTWVKVRNATGQHSLFDAVRGATKRLDSSSSGGQVTASSSLTSFDSDGFSFGNEAGNNSGENYVAWNWKSGAASNIAGSSTGVSAASRSTNADAGFSIVTYTMSSSIIAVPHGLNSAPKMAIVKRTDSSSSWFLYNTVASGKGRGFLNGTDAFDNSGMPTFGATNFTLQDSDPFSSGSVVVYFFAEVTGYQKFGTYQATGSAGSPTVTTGFQPRFVMVKNIDRSQEWIMIDSARNNGANSLRPDSTGQENTNGDNAITLNSDGFTIAVSGSGVNFANGDDFFYWAIA